MDKTNKFLFTIRSLTGGGAERVVSVLTSKMAEDGYDVSIICYKKTEHDYKISDSVKIYVMPERADNIFGKVQRLADMKKIISKIQPDIVIPFVGTILFVSYYACRMLQIPFVRTIRVSPWHEEGGKLQKILRNYLNTHANAIMVQNEEQVLYFPEELKKKIFVIPNPIADEFVKFYKKKYSPAITTIVTAGRLTDQKNHELLIDSFAEVVKEKNNLRLYIYGEGPNRTNLAEKIAELGVTDSCFLMGRHDNFLKILLQADLFVMTSKYEGMPNALMEAMAVGLPSISSDCPTGPCSLIKDGDNGYLFKSGSKESLISKMKYCVNYPQVMEQIGKKARKDICKRYTYTAVYSNLIGMIHVL